MLRERMSPIKIISWRGTTGLLVIKKGNLHWATVTFFARFFFRELYMIRENSSERKSHSFVAVLSGKIVTLMRGKCRVWHIVADAGRVLGVSVNYRNSRDGRGRKYLVIIVGGSTTGALYLHSRSSWSEMAPCWTGRSTFHSSVWISNAIVHGGASD